MYETVTLDLIIMLFNDIYKYILIYLNTIDILLLIYKAIYFNFSRFILSGKNNNFAESKKLVDRTAFMYIFYYNLISI